MLDVSRNKVPKLETLFYLIDLFVSWKINELQVYIEHTFAFEEHETVWKDASPYTTDDIRKLDTYCHERFIELVPNLNCFGHMSRWLTHEPYQQLAEQPGGGDTDFGYRKEPQGLCPIDPGSISLAEDLITQMVSCFKSRQVNVGCDETIDLGYGRSKEAVKKDGRGQVYLDYLRKVQEICKKEDHQMQFWADMLLKYPELNPDLPSDSIALNWGYEAIHPFEEETRLLELSGTPFYVCPGTSSWNSIAGRTTNMKANIRKAAHYGKKHGAVGMMTTDWGDNGHLQPLLSSFPGFILGAAISWNQNEEPALSNALDQYVFHNQGWGELQLEVGDLDASFGIYIHNQTILYQLLQETPENILKHDSLTIESLDQALSNALGMRAKLEDLRLRNPVNATLEEEFHWVIEMLIHACLRGLEILGRNQKTDLRENAKLLREQHKRLWGDRNRPSEYGKSRALFDVLIRP